MSEMATEGMTFDEAAAALRESGTQEQSEAQAATPELGHFATPAEAEQAATPTPGEEAPTLTTTPEQDAEVFSTPEGEDSFMGQDFNPDLLPPELQDGFKQLQGAFTRKTQELAEERKSYEALGSPEEIQQARDFYQSLQDPEYLKAFYGELGAVVKELGLAEDPAAPEDAAPPAPAVLPPELAGLTESDPELAPLVEQFTNMQQRLDQFEAQQTQREQALAEERQLMTEAAEIDRMVQAVRAEHPDYGDDDFQAIYDRAVAFDGNVLRAAELYEADRSRIIEGYLSQKQTPHAVTPTSGGGVVTEEESAELATLDDAQKAAEAYLTANDLQEFGG